MTSLLILESDQQRRSKMVRWLVLAGYDVTSFAGTDHALTRCKEGHTDVVIVELQMAAKDDFEFLRILRQEASYVRAIVTCSTLEVSSEEELQCALARERGAVEILAAPLDERKLLSVTSRAVGSAHGFRGWVHGLSLIDLLQLYHYSRQSLTIIINESAEIHIVEGEIQHARTQEQTGQEAVRDLLLLSGGVVKTAPLRSDQKSVDRPFQSLVLDCLREADESQRDRDGDDPFADPMALDTGEFSLGSLLPQASSGAPQVSGGPEPPARPGPSLFPGHAMVDGACDHLVEMVDGALGAAVVDLSTGVLLALSWKGDGDPSEILQRTARVLFRPSGLAAIDRVISGEHYEDSEQYPEEVQLASEKLIHVAKRLRRRNTAVVLLTKAGVNSALCWSEIRHTTRALERILV